MHFHINGLRISDEWRELRGMTLVRESYRRLDGQEPTVVIRQDDNDWRSNIELSPDGARHVIRELQEWLALVDSGTL